VKTRLLPTDTPAALEAAVADAVACLSDGQPVALPTETVYGLAADALRPEAVVKIFEAKERPFFDPLICHLPDREWLERMTEIPERAARWSKRSSRSFWPGPLTLVLPRREIVPISSPPACHRGRADERAPRLPRRVLRLRQPARRAEREPLRPHQPHRRGARPQRTRRPHPLILDGGRD
jgi:tRNA A37 threonylcarbamoyladenosine synthetase subunit TsaC/SUA5/YrdC